MEEALEHRLCGSATHKRGEARVELRGREDQRESRGRVRKSPMDRTGTQLQSGRTLGFPQGQGQRQGNGSAAVLEVGRGFGGWRSHFIRVSLDVLLGPEADEAVRPLPTQPPKVYSLVFREVVGAERGTGLNFFLPQPPSLLLPIEAKLNLPPCSLS